MNRFSRHLYLGHAHFNSIYDAGSTVTSFNKVEYQEARKEFKNFNKKFGKFGWENMGSQLLVDNPQKEAKWSFLLISEFYLHVVNGFFSQGYSISIETIKNLTYKKKLNTYVVSFNCEIDFTTYGNQIPTGNHDFSLEIGGKLFTELLNYIDAFKLLAKFKAGGEEGEEYFDMVKGLTSFKVFTTESPSIATEMDGVISKYLKSTKLTELMRVKDKETNVKIYIKQGKDEDHVSELLMFVNGVGKYTAEAKSPMKAESVIIALTGDIDLNKISKLTDAHISGSGEHLNKANK